MSLKQEYISSPLNYTGGKFKLLPQLMPLFPTHIDTFIDLFCGGCNVGININANKIICNDINTSLINLFKYFKMTSYEELYIKIQQIISKYNLSNSFTNGYSFYGCNSAVGLGHYNKPGFLRLRDDFNNLSTSDLNYYPYLYVLIIYAFNNQIRFNEAGDFNLPVGKRDFNKNIQKKLFIFLKNIQKLQFTNYNFLDFDFSSICKNDFVYVDPPYLITCATYNEKNGWNEKKENELLTLLDNLNEKKIKFALSNILYNNDKQNTILIRWLNKNSVYKCHHLDFTYKNSNYHKKNKTNNVAEVLITNY